MAIQDQNEQGKKSGINVLVPQGSRPPNIAGVTPQQNGEIGTANQSAFTSSTQATQPNFSTDSQPVKLESYLKANEDQGQNLMQEVQKNQGSQADQIRQQIEAQKAQTLGSLDNTYQNQQKLNQGIFGQNNQGGLVNDVSNFKAHQNLGNYANQDVVDKAKSIYAGTYNPNLTSMDRQKLESLQRRADSASKMFAGLGRDDYRKMIMQKTFGKGNTNYTKGQENLNNLLLGRGTSPTEQKQFISSMQNLGRNTQSSIQQARNAVRARQNQISAERNQMRDNLRKALDEKYGLKNEEGVYTTGIGKELQDKLNTQKALEQGIKESFGQDGDYALTQDQMDYLGLSEGQRLWDYNPADLIQAGDRVYADVANQADLAKLKSIAELTGKNQDIIQNLDRVLTQDEIIKNKELRDQNLIDNIKKAEQDRIADAYREIGSGRLMWMGRPDTTWSSQKVADQIESFKRGRPYRHSWWKNHSPEANIGTVHNNWEDADKDLNYLLNNKLVKEDVDWVNRKNIAPWNKWRDRGTRGINTWKDLVNKRLGLQSDE